MATPGTLLRFLHSMQTASSFGQGMHQQTMTTTQPYFKAKAQQKLNKNKIK